MSNPNIRYRERLCRGLNTLVSVLDALAMAAFSVAAAAMILNLMGYAPEVTGHLMMVGMMTFMVFAAPGIIRREWREIQNK